ncbi:sugar O-methyltransferase domain protein [Leptospira kirschneri str. H2]|nr:putative sugar O-methyltransferase [Leptospira kirschneri]EKO58930.1 sugar O-methyltransferase domain protein [Leptospira kirschneri str. H2]
MFLFISSKISIFQGRLSKFVKRIYKEKRNKKILEIGGGNGNFSSILHNSLFPVQCILVDLSEMIPICAAYLSKIFPKTKIVLPNEVNKTSPKDYDFLFLTTTGIDLLPKNYVDLSRNEAEAILYIL